MFVRVLIVGILFVLTGSSGCSSQSRLANSATSSLGDWSPMGSRKVTRNRHFTLAAHYHLYLTTLTDLHSTAPQPELTRQLSSQMTRQLRSQFAQVDDAAPAESVRAALVAAVDAGADILLLPRLQSWPNLDPVRLQECESNNGKTQLSLQPCDAAEKNKESELVISVALYDVRTGMQIDSITAHSRRGMAAYVSDRANAELEQLCKLVAGQLSSQEARP